MAIVWKRTKPRHPEFDALIEDVAYRTRAASQDERASLRDLAALRRRPLVRAAMTRSRRSRHRALALVVAVPLAAWPAYLILHAQPAGAAAAGWLALGVVCLWPAVCFLGAAFSAAGAVIAEREQETAMQLVLTPVAKRDIVAAVILPAVWPYIWGPVAALPLYVLAGGHPWLQSLDPPLLTTLWPARMLLPLTGTPDAGLSWSGVLIGLAMALTDAACIWAAAHWGAIYGLRVGQTAMAAGLLAGRILLMALYAVLLAAACGLLLNWLNLGLALPLVVFSESVQRAAAIVIVGLSILPPLAWFTWRVLLIAPLKAALYEFSYFDWLAFEDYRPEPWRGWDFFHDRGDRV